MMILGCKCFGYVIGFIFGIFTFEILRDISNEPRFVSEKAIRIPVLTKHSYQDWLEKKGFVLSLVDQDELSFGKRSKELQEKQESRLLFNFIHITCVVFITKSENAYMVANTWGRHCNSLLFYSSNVTKLNYIEAYVIPMKSSWQFICESIRHLWFTKKHFQWVIFSFDDVYVIPENLRYFVASKDYNKPQYYGHNVYFWNVLYNSGQTGIVLNKGSILAIVNRFNDALSCEKSGRFMKNGDYYLGKYLTELNITAGSGHDSKGRERFHILKLEILLTNSSESIVGKYAKKSVWPPKLGKECCSDTTISFPTNGENLLVHFLLHQVKVFSHGYLGNRPKNETDDQEAWKETVREEFGSNVNISEVTALKYYQLWEQKVKEVEDKKRFI